MELGCYLMLFDYTNIFHHMHRTNNRALTVYVTHHYLPFVVCVLSIKFSWYCFYFFMRCRKLFSGGERELLIVW